MTKKEDLIHITSITIYEMNIGFERTKRKISEKIEGIGLIKY